MAIVSRIWLFMCEILVNYSFNLSFLKKHLKTNYSQMVCKSKSISIHWESCHAKIGLSCNLTLLNIRKSQTMPLSHICAKITM